MAHGKRYVENARDGHAYREQHANDDEEFFHASIVSFPVHSNAKIRFQSLFMLITVQPFCFASS